MFSVKVDAEIQLVLLEQHHAQSLFHVLDSNRTYLNERLAWIDSIRSLADAESFIARSLKRFANQKGFNSGIFYQGELIGMIGLYEVNQANQSTYLGYWLIDSYQKRGIMRRAYSFMVDYCFKEYGLNRVEIYAAVDNLKSRAIPEALGFKQEGVLRNE